MSRLLVITRPNLVDGFRLAGVEAYAAEDVETAQELIESWVEAGETGLLAIDDGFLEHINPVVMKRLEATEQLDYLAIPGGEPLGPEATRRQRLAQQIRRAIGFHITFKGEESQTP
jgi:V/A-type H+-transporting ATPase subunit F